MKRKVNRVGQNTLTVSLPTEWTKRNNVEKGDEIELLDNGKELTLTFDSKPQEKEISVDFSGLGSMLNRAVCATYKAGFTKLKIKYSTPEELDVIQGAIDRSCHVFEIMDIKDNTVHVKTISALNPQDFENVLRKIGHALIDVAKDTFKALKEKNISLMQTTILKDKIVDRHTDFCRRLMNSGYTGSYTRPFPLYTIIEHSEILADIFKEINTDGQKIKVEKDLIDLFYHVNDLIKHFYDTFYHFDMERIKLLGKKEVSVRRLIDEVSSKKRSDSKILCHIVNAFETCFELKSAMMTLRLG